MNNKDRTKLKRAGKLIKSAIEIVQGVALDEEEKYENLPEGLKQSENGENLNYNKEELDQLQQELDDIRVAILDF